MASVWFAPQALEQARQAVRWWHEHRPESPHVLATELGNAIALLHDAPDVGVGYSHPEVPGVRRLLLRVTRYHLYYVHNPYAAEVEILAFWSAVRGRGPVL